MKTAKILIVDDHALVRDGIISMLVNIEDFEIVGEAADHNEAILKTEIHQPNIILMDIILGDSYGIETATEIKKTFPDVKVIFLSMEVSEKFISEAIKSGANGYIPKDIKKDILIEGIRKVKNGGKFFSERVSEIILEKLYTDTNSTKKKGDKKLSNRETEVLQLIASGVSNRDIAEQLFISVRTVDAHRNNILQKLVLKSTADLVKYAIKNELIDLD